MQRPGIFVDSTGKVLAWSLPGILSGARQVRATPYSYRAGTVAKRSRASGSKGKGSKPMVQWRTAPTFYQPGRKWPAGSWLATPGGYAVGHKTADYSPKPSASMRRVGSIAWCRDMRETSALFSAILRVAHPELYSAGRSSLLELSALERAEDPLPFWPSIFNTVQLLSNRESPFHRDTAGQPSWYDLLVTLGNYRRAELVLRNLGVQVAYKPGTIALLSSLVIHHGVRAVEPDRLCYSWFMSEALHKNLGVPTVPWMSLDVHQF
ncbi:hypothetical protein K466DRAFT_502948 [Polyporus arcularius HHB13444]|uniref:2OGFeDO JBP1/TET oxygenase domain-containing protein n=1 Tax=Polyporus arcularius HHB13444 TaxID=1314778 RepID=A0A5C3NTZ9_9APHY|nr:hypothetical protein K466DRAFT_502948 [Polyporus arcularius HHB13444]